MSDSKEYSVSLKYSIGVASGSMSWDISAPLSGELLDDLIEELKYELGTTKDVFVESVSVNKNTKHSLDKYLSNCDVEI